MSVSSRLSIGTVSPAFHAAAILRSLQLGIGALERRHQLLQLRAEAPRKSICSSAVSSVPLAGAGARERKC
jgi:hypothetical protein